MSVQNVSLSDMFGWIPAAGRMLKSDWRRFLAAGAWMLLVIVLPIAAFFGIAFASGLFTAAPGSSPFGHDITWFWVSYAVLVLLSLLLQPPLVAGWFGLCGDVDIGRSGRGRDIFAPFRHRELWVRSLVVVLLTLVIGVLLFCVTLLPFLSGLMAYQAELGGYQAAAMTGAQMPPPMPPLGFFIGYFVFIVAAVVLQLVAALAMSEVASRPTSPWSALVLATRAVLRNFFKLVLFGICVSVLFWVALMVVLVPVILIGIGLGFINPILSAVVMVAGYLALLAAMYPLMFIFHYLMWKGLMTEPSPPPMIAVDA